MTHKEYLEMLIGPLAGEGGGGGDAPSGSVTLTQNTSPSGVNVADKATAVVQVQGGADAADSKPVIPAGYTELKMPTGLKASVVTGYLAGQTNKTISAKIPLWIVLTNGDKIALTGITSDTNQKFCVAGTVSGNVSYGAYQNAKLTIDYDGKLGNDAVVPSGYTEIKTCMGSNSSNIKTWTAGSSRSMTVAHDAVVAIGDKIALTGLGQDTGDEVIVAGTVTNVTQSSTTKTVTLKMDFDGMVGKTAPGIYIKTNTTTDVKGREFAVTDVHGSGTIQIVANGQVTVDGYKYADVNVQAPPSGGSDVVDFTGVIDIGENGIHASSNNPNTTITMLRFPNLETLNAGNFGFFTALTDIYFGPQFSNIKGHSFDACNALASVYFDSWAGALPYITSGSAPGQGTQCIYYMPNSLISMAQWDPNWSSLYQMNRLVDLDQAPYSPVVLYRPGQKCIYQGYQWENGSSGQPGVPGVDPAWQQIGPA